MSLQRQLSGEFDAGVRLRGQTYFWQNSVHIRRATATQVEAIVRGSSSYQVDLDYDDGQLEVWCDCPYFESEGPCKHLWATILKVDALRHLTAAETSLYLKLRYDGSGPDDEFENDFEEGHQDRAARTGPKRAPPGPKVPPWRRALDDLASPQGLRQRPEPAWPSTKEILYVVDALATERGGGLILSFLSRARKANGDWGRVQALSLRRGQAPSLPMPEDRAIFSALMGSTQYYGQLYGNDYESWGSSRHVPHHLAASLLPLMAETERLYLRTAPEAELSRLTWDGNGVWNLRLEIRRDTSPGGKAGGWLLTGCLCRAAERMEVGAPLAVVPGGLVFTADRAAVLDASASFPWIAHLRKGGALQAKKGEGDELLAALLRSPNLPEIEVPEELRFAERKIAPRPWLRVRRHKDPGYADRLSAELFFDYQGNVASRTDAAPGFYDAATRTFTPRDRETEAAAAAVLPEVGLRWQDSWGEQTIAVPSKKLPGAVRALLERGWRVEADGKTFRKPSSYKIGVASGVDWFDLEGEVNYGDASAGLPELLQALRRGDNMVLLGDGSYGMLPDEWLRKFGAVAGMGQAENGHIRFRRSQAGLLDALLAVQPEVSCDATFAAVRKEIASFQGVQAARQPKGFVGKLRDYQREGLGWMEFLQRFSFGGCLADDMGVGKTAQVLALLEQRREAREAGKKVGPSLVVVPRSLIFNWKEESARFTPRLSVLDYTGAERDAAAIEGADLILTTYGTLRRDAATLQSVEFDYVILDEAQAIKNASSESAKAARLLRGEWRLALSGTPVENHLGELWSLFEFLNPGLLGSASVFKLAGGAMRNPDEETRKLLAHALRPFILRRTKDQVARELPPKTEQTIYCELEPAQRKLYNQLREHYRSTLLQRVDDAGLAKSKMHVLEALLRLRQAACHPGLIDAKHASAASAKLEVLLEKLREVLDEGHKALVFSQFTSLLAIVRKELDGQGTVYEYLDGATRDRQARVNRFQTDPDCKLFLISLKAGGLGLNLTAAEYVFLLDPWWNPAVEAQAVDRAHRIGQQRQVFAYRLIARDTVEEKVLELQNSKRDLASAILNADRSLMRDLKREDLELLLS